MQRWILRVGIYRPVGVPTANHVVTHTFMGRTIYTNGVGVKFCSVHSTGFPRTLTTNRQRPDTGQLVNGVLELAERMAKRHIPMTMEDWAKQIDTILAAGGNEVLQTAGSVSAEEAKEHAETEFEKYRIVQDRLFQSDFDKYLGELPFDGE